MKLLFLYSHLNGQYFNIGLDAAFKKHIPEYRKFGYAERTYQYNRDEINTQALLEAKAFKPDVVFLQHIDYGDIYLETIKELSKSSLVIMWSGDMYQPKAPAFYFDVAPYVVSLLSNMDYVNELRERGYKSYFANHYYQDGYYHIPNTEKIYDIVFIGSEFDRYPLSAERREMIKFLYKTYPGFKLFGDNWSGQFGARYASREEANLIYNQAKIAINFSNLDAPYYTSDRLMHIMGAECFCLSRKFPQCEDLFSSMSPYNLPSQIDYFHTLDELKKQCDYWLSTKMEQTRNIISKQGRERCISLFGDEAFVWKVKRIYAGDKIF